MGRFQERVASLLCRYNCCHYPATIGVISTLRDENESLAGRYFPQVETLPWELGDYGLQEMERYRSPCSSFLRCKLSDEFTSGCLVSSFLFAGRLPYEPRTECSEDFRRIFGTHITAFFVVIRSFNLCLNYSHATRDWWKAERAPGCPSSQRRVLLGIRELLKNIHIERIKLVVQERKLPRWAKNAGLMTSWPW